MKIIMTKKEIETMIKESNKMNGVVIDLENIENQQEGIQAEIFNSNILLSYKGKEKKEMNKYVTVRGLENDDFEIEIKEDFVVDMTETFTGISIDLIKSLIPFIKLCLGSVKERFMNFMERWI